MQTFEFDYNGRKTKCLAKSELQDGKYYRGECRNAIADLARWDTNKNEFYYLRSKFGDTFVEAISHPEDEAHYDVFCVYVLVEKPEFVIPEDGTYVDKQVIHNIAVDYEEGRWEKLQKVFGEISGKP